MVSRKLFNDGVLIRPVKIINEETVEVIDIYCSHFGCNKKLSSLEKLFTDRCPDHPRIASTFFNGKL